MSRQKTVLFIDDEPMYNLPYRLELELRGYEVVYCRSVEECVHTMQGDLVPDCIVLDVIMAPGTTFRVDQAKQGLDTGFLLFAVLRRRYGDVPIVVWTCRPEEDAERELNKEGPQDFVFIGKAATVTPFLLASTVEKKIGDR